MASSSSFLVSRQVTAMLLRVLLLAGTVCVWAKSGNNIPVGDGNFFFSDLFIAFLASPASLSTHPVKLNVVFLCLFRYDLLHCLAMPRWHVV